MKCEQTAEKYRNDGNLYFRNKKFREALEAYNQSLCFAGSDGVSLAYGNRSAVYLEVKLFNECLENIKLACDHGFPEEKRQKLFEREQKCKKLMKIVVKNHEGDSKKFFTLSHAPNSKIPFIVECLQLCESEKFGRYLITNQNLKTGDVIAIEEPFYKFIDAEVIHSRCANCLKSNNLNLIPCTTCTKCEKSFNFSTIFTNFSFIAAMYCSNACQAKHYKNIHSFECCKKPLPIVLLVVAKMIFIALSITKSFKKLCKLIKESKNKTVFDFDLSHPEDISCQQNILTVINSCAMSEHSEIVMSEKMKEVFDQPPFDSIWETPEERELLIEFFHKQLRIHNTNKLEMGEPTFESLPDEKFWYSKTIGGGLCPFASLFNHSCDSNVKRFTVDNKLVFVIARPIKAGEQLFISYGYSSYRMSKEERQLQLSKFSFECDCEACVKNYPQLPALPRIEKNFIEPKFKAFELKKAVEEFRRNCDFIERNIKHHPSFETTMLINHNEHLLHQISRSSIGEL